MKQASTQIVCGGENWSGEWMIAEKSQCGVFHVQCCYYTTTSPPSLVSAVIYYKLRITTVLVCVWVPIISAHPIQGICVIECHCYSVTLTAAKEMNLHEREAVQAHTLTLVHCVEGKVTLEDEVHALGGLMQGPSVLWCCHHLNPYGLLKSLRHPSWSWSFSLWHSTTAKSRCPLPQGSTFLEHLPGWVLVKKPKHSN